MISVIIPVVREQKLSKLKELIKKNAGLMDYELITEVDKHKIGCPKMVKKLVKKCNGDYICFLGDDTIPQENFLKHALETMKCFKGEWGLVGLNDNTGRRLPTHWLASKKLLKHLGGEFFHTGYKHCYCDNELQFKTELLNRYMYSLKSVVLHDHPILQKDNNLLDEHYERAYEKDNMEHDRLLFNERIKGITKDLVL